MMISCPKGELPQPLEGDLLPGHGRVSLMEACSCYCYIQSLLRTGERPCSAWAGWGCGWFEFAGGWGRGADIGKVNWVGLMIVVDCLGASEVGGWWVHVLHGQVGDGYQRYSELATGTSPIPDSGPSGLEECRGRCYVTGHSETLFFLA
jgi:hypothetical protein